MPADTVNVATTVNPEIVVGLVAAGAALVGGLIAGVANYLVSRRALSRSGARLLADLQILEKARDLKLDPRFIAAIEARVEYSVGKHTQGSVERKEPEVQ